MIDQGISTISGRRVLLLQGPVGPFFSRLAHDLRAVGASVHKINFNAGDWLFYPHNAINFRGTLEEWPDFLNAVIDKHRIETILLFGDCRPVHQAARQLAWERGLELGVFEEGYIRPDYVTFERHGVNANSRIPRNPRFYLSKPVTEEPTHITLPNAYWYMVLWGFLYFTVGSLGRFIFSGYRHHRPMKLAQALPWIRSAIRKQWYRLGQHRSLKRLTGELSGHFFLVPLQVYNDAQIKVHSTYKDIRPFIEEVVASFAKAADKDAFLVFKHHPMDRGYTHYGKQIAASAKRHGVEQRCLYIHDLHMPTLLANAQGVIVINSVSGLQALRKGVPVKTLGEAVYDMMNLCFQGSLDEFWVKASQATPEPFLLQQFVHYLIERTQVNASFYRVRSDATTATGMQWQTRSPLPVPDAIRSDIMSRDITPHDTMLPNAVLAHLRDIQHKEQPSSLRTYP